MINQLLLAKRLFIIGSEYSDKNDPISTGMAISLFQDAVEIFMWSLVKEFEAAAKENTPFSAFFEMVANAPKNTSKKKVPLQAKMLELNKARINFKHYGNLPDQSEAKKFRAYTEQFLVTSYLEFFNIDFIALSIVELVQLPTVRNHLKAAEILVSDKNYESAMQEIATAREILFDRVAKFFPSINSINFSEADRSFRAVSRSQSSRGVFSAIEEYLKNSRKFSILSLLDIPLNEYLAIDAYLPTVLTMMSGDRRFIKSRSVSPTKEIANKAIQILVNASLRAKDIL